MMDNGQPSPDAGRRTPDAKPPTTDKLALVTGATGFVGASVVRVLLEAGYQVRALVRPASDLRNLRDLPVERVQGDLRDLASLEKALQGCRTLFHVAASYTYWSLDPGAIYQDNVDGTKNILLAAHRAGIERVVYTSTVGCIGIPEDGRPGNEDTPITLEDCHGHYKRSKFMAEQEALRIGRQTGLPIVIVNPSTPVGSYDIKPTPTGKMIVDFVNGRSPAYIDTGLNLIDVADVAAGHLLAAERGRIGERYILGHANLHLREAFTLLAELTGRPPPRFQIPYAAAWLAGAISQGISRITRRPPGIPLEAVEQARKFMFFDASKAVRELGLPQTDIRLALKKAVAWFFANGYTRRGIVADTHSRSQ